MNFLILDAYHKNFLQSFYLHHPEVDTLNYKDHFTLLMAQRYAISDAYSYNLKKLGHKAQEIITNDDNLQMKWARENHIHVPSFSQYLDYGLKRLIKYDWRYKIIKAQVEHIRPDILFIHENNILSDAFISNLKPFVRLIVGQIASKIPIQRTFRSYDLILTSFPYFVEYFHNKKITSYYLQLGFDERVLNEVNKIDSKYNVTFVGGLSRAHRQRYEFLEKLNEHLNIELFGYGKEKLEQSSQVYYHHHGEIWGVDMYRILAQSRITLNCHIGAAKKCANNMRLYEATGMGACLVTDWKENLPTLFKPEKEIITYRSLKDCVEKIKYYLENDSERKKIAHAGKQRTLAEHTYYNRMKKLIEIVEGML